jgi:chemotaxis protein MotA
MVFKGASPAALLNPAAILIIFVGTAGALLNAFPMYQFTKLGTMFKVLFKKTEFPEVKDLARQFVKLSQIARKEGLLSLEQTANSMEDVFMRTGLSMVVDGIEANVIQEVLESQIEALKSRHKLGAQLFAQAGMYAPTLGVLGAVIGLVAALGNLSDIEKLGHSIAAAFIATMFGIFSGYVLWHPFANKLKQLTLEEVEVREMMIQGILALQAGDAPAVMQSKMVSYVPDREKDELLKEWSK